ncbi:MAG TPA: VOC family protein [Streptosporangiaceae bacterium]|nr:VOC family protein [Streptosporangiaceae bacterium]
MRLIHHNQQHRPRRLLCATVGPPAAARQRASPATPRPRGRLPRAEARMLAMGATRLPSTEPGFRVYADPAGHPFCLAWE